MKAIPYGDNCGGEIDETDDGQDLDSRSISGGLKLWDWSWQLSLHSRGVHDLPLILTSICPLRVTLALDLSMHLPLRSLTSWTTAETG